jgi:hypothetical protein
MERIKKFIWDVIVAIVSYWIIYVGGAAVIVFASFEHLPIYQLLLIVLVAVSLVFLCINQIDIFRRNHKRAITKLSDSEVEGIIRNWIDDPIFKFQRKINNECLFQFEITDEQERIITISRPKANPTRIELTSSITLGEKHKTKYSTFKQSDKNDIVHELRIEMARFGVSFQGINTKLERINISDVILLDDTLNEFYFRQRIFFVIRAIVLLIELITQQLEDINESNPHKEDSPNV